MRRVLILGGTAEARDLAARLADVPGLRVVSSLAGRVADPRLPAGEVRIGGFGGPAGLAAWLRDQRIDRVVDATHPFAEQMSASAAEASRLTGVPLLALRRPGWVEEDGDDWRRVPSLDAAAAALPDGARAFLTTGRRSIPVFAARTGVWFLARSVDPPEGHVPSNVGVLLSRGPYTLDGERALIREHRLDVLVTKDSGGALTRPKLIAARQARIPVVMVDRPPVPGGVKTAGDATAAARWAQG
ncbi:precorrin-6A/cobalt-precorrin-6A reductase [Actinomadura pelletieri DSM 43383]|uniref:Precorrin-6A/cobalt-precorrin-6A reductase n=1 Tax=Actinomadura pelletieri DSM 43383 TaxID=1120940 RepID=A0A495Q9L6_9ACTN|nr:cobalt-precorrin-6A reductase [Actinomadura pelletieri]RKS68142.1 precorrin-6A/cobalt-precorrin-6A reductase [Actinomadura pelletieri DSM 43383]